jgi:multidrug resistance protein, MATE family
VNDRATQSELEAGRTGALREVWTVAWPTVLTMTSYTVMQFVDSLMVAQVGPLQVAAQGNGGVWAFTPIVFAFGILTVVNTYVSQNLGAKRPERGPAYAWASIWLSGIMWLALMLPFALVLPLVFGMMGHSEELRRMETGYGQILLVGSIVLMASRGLNHYFFGMHRPKVVAVAAVVGNIVNGLANYVLIFGHQGVPALGLPGVPGVPVMGLYGAAIGTVIGTMVELAIPAAIFLGPKLNAELGTRSAWRPDVASMRDLIRIGWPAAAQFANEVACWAIFTTVFVGRFGEAHMTAGWAALRYMHLSFMPAVGLSVAATSLVGRYIGAGQPDVAVKRARTALTMGMVYMTACAAAFVLFRHELIGLFVRTDVSAELAAEIVRIGGLLMICAAVFQTADAFGIVYTGALRGAGDTVWPGVVTIIYSWAFIVLGGWLFVVFWPGLESLGPWIAAAAYIILYGVTMALRFESGRWRSIQLLDREDEPRSAMEPVLPGPPPSSTVVRDLADDAVSVMESRR